jgi:hypothetical protein
METLNLTKTIPKNINTIKIKKYIKKYKANINIIPNPLILVLKYDVMKIK